MANARHNWSHWFTVWREIRKTGVSLAEFCRRESLPYDPCRIAFKKLEKNGYETETSTRKCNDTQWAIWKQEFLAGDFKTISEFVRTKGLKQGTGFVSRNTRGWLVERGKIRERNEVENLAAITEHEGCKAIAKLHARVLSALYDCLNDLEANGPKRKGLHEGIDNVRDNADFLRGVSTAIDALLKVLPPISKIEGTVAARDILKQLVEGSMDVTQASLTFEELGIDLPQTVRILLAKEEPPEPDPGSNFVPDDDFLEAAYQEGIARIRQQEEVFLPGRRFEIEQLKIECEDADSFRDNI